MAKGVRRPPNFKPEILINDSVRGYTEPGIRWDSDPKAPGFGVRVYPAGAKTFLLDYRIDGRQRRITIGHFPLWSANAAREQAKELRKEIAKGHDPADQKRKRREAPAVQELIDRYIEEHLPTKSGDELRVNDEKRMLAEIGKRLGKHTKVADVLDGDIRDMHRKISESIGRYGPRRVRANRILAVCSKMFSLSLKSKAGETLPWRDQAMGNPCKGVERNHEEGRERFFGKGELERIADALSDYPGVAANTVRLIMFTGCRPGEALQAKWSEFDKEPGYWNKPSAHVKQRRVHRVPLSPPAIELIDRLRKQRKGEWVFPGDIASQPLKALWHVWHYVVVHAELESDDKGRAARVYDLRHTFASVAVGAGLNLPIIGKLLGHTQQRTTQRYAHLDDDPLREAANRVGNAIAGKGGAEIVSIRGAKS